MSHKPTVHSERVLRPETVDIKHAESQREAIKPVKPHQLDKLPSLTEGLKKPKQ